MSEVVAVSEEAGKLDRLFAAINPPTKELIESKEDELYAADVFLPEKLVKNCRIVALCLAVILSVLIFLIDPRTLNELRQHFVEVSIFRQYDIVIPYKYFTLIQVVAASLTFVLLYPKLVRGFFATTLKLKLAEKREKIDRNLYTALCMLAGFGRGGVPVSRAVELVARSNLDGIREEFAKIHTSVSILGYDLRTAMLRVALTTPSERMAHFLKGFVSYLERSKNYGDYVDEYLQLDNVNRRIELAAYSEKLRQLSAMYVTLVTILASLSIVGLALNVMEQGADYTPIVIYIALPGISLAMALLYYTGSPDKGLERTKKREAMYLAVAAMVTGILAGLIPILDVKVPLLAAGVALALAAHFYVRGAMRADSEIENDLNTLLMSLYAASRAGESVVDALKSASGELAKRLANVVASSSIRPVGEALSEESKKAKHPFLTALLYVLGSVVHSTRKFSDVLTAMIYEYHRYIEYTKLRKSVVNITAVIVLTALVLTAFCMGIMKLQMVPTLAEAAEKAKEQLYFDPEYAKRLAGDTVIMLASTTPFVLASVSWDFRGSFKYFIGTYLLALFFVLYT